MGLQRLYIKGQLSEIGTSLKDIKRLIQDEKLPQGVKLSIALDYWTSLFRQSFMAVTGYFLDIDWNYREILLGFEPLSSSHTGAYLSTVLQQVLEEHQVETRILTVTTDNAANNSILIDSLSKSLQSLEIPNQIPYIAHVIQLSLNELLGWIERIRRLFKPLRRFDGLQSSSTEALNAMIIFLIFRAKNKSLSQFKTFAHARIQHS
ncbi:hypothetical protein TSTA_119020 [Talaromyces stipitatus ATCC 10500]|uniref:DUF659 domain-containing protein n=1 Tax=Talaromyces stipitatus (strain ATCC 10500 / CBS 375.48 / QM 6759 / NRRL 1006) TaxID=441959 RepID=B8M9Y6_TALSN|nr:uncharacterized protein TSTA_119020 [Talaromyces stipitatus ATCC 10500]EED18138.1 hypothetical protein TSTA_119020 [Talaromyces stipitatus ATCC 10500]